MNVSYFSKFLEIIFFHFPAPFQLRRTRTRSLPLARPRHRRYWTNQKTHKNLWVRTENTQKTVGAHRKYTKTCGYTHEKITIFQQKPNIFENYRKLHKCENYSKNPEKFLRKSRGQAANHDLPDVFSSVPKVICLIRYICRFLYTICHHRP